MLKDIFKNRIILGLFSIIIALILCFGITPMFNQALKEKREIVRVVSDVKKGDKITKKMISVVEVGGYNLPSSILTKMDQVIGKYANTDLYKGDYILSTKVSETPMLKNEYLNKLDGKNRAISITIQTFADGLSGKLEKGDIVSLIASDVGEMRETVIPLELQFVEIIATTTSNGNDHNVQEEGEDTELASTITVLATPEQARLLAELEQTGNIHVALVYRGESEVAQQFLEEQQKVLKELLGENE